MNYDKGFGITEYFLLGLAKKYFDAMMETP